MKRFAAVLFLIFFLISSAVSANCPCICTDDSFHLIVISGQSNARLINPVWVKNIIGERLGSDHFEVVNYSIGATAIRRWDEQIIGDIYRQLVRRVDIALDGRVPDSVTFAWHQGESDAIYHKEDKYRNSFDNLYAQFERDFGEFNLILIRLSDPGSFPSWMAIRNIHENIAEDYPRTTMINTDDLNDPYIHKILKFHYWYPYSYIELARRISDAFMDSICLEEN